MKRPNPNATPSGTPINVLSNNAKPDTRSDSKMISSSPESARPISLIASTKPPQKVLIGLLL